MRVSKRVKIKAQAGRQHSPFLLTRMDNEAAVPDAAVAKDAASSKTVDLTKEQELRFEVDFGATVVIKVSQW